MNAKQIAQTVLLAVAWGVLLLVIVSLMGCEGIRRQEGDVRSIRINADCEGNTVDVQMNQDMSEDHKKVQVTK